MSPKSPEPRLFLTSVNYFCSPKVWGSHQMLGLLLKQGDRVESNDAEHTHKEDKQQHGTLCSAQEAAAN